MSTLASVAKILHSYNKYYEKIQNSSAAIALESRYQVEKKKKKIKLKANTYLHLDFKCQKYTLKCLNLIQERFKLIF